MNRELEYLFNPRSVAIIGASKSLLGGGGIFMNALIEMGFPKIFPINPKGGEIYGLKTYPNVKDVPEPVDYAIVAVPAKIVPKVIGDCVEKGVKAAHIFTSGFSEVGEDGKKLEKEIADIARGGTRIIGPNCMGIYCPASKLSYFPGSPKRGGSVSFISQSGRYATFTIISANQLGIRFNKIISFGNGCDLESTDFLECLTDDPETKIIVMYVEGVKDGKRFFNAIKEATKKKPVIVWKGGRTEEGTKAVASHTGALAGSNLIWESLFEQAGAISVRSMDELLDTLSAFLNLPYPKGRNVAILTGGGGETVTSADACADEGLNLVPFDSGTIEKVGRILSMPGTILRNPLDYSGLGFSPGVIRRLSKIVAEDENVDILLVLLFLGPGMLKAMMGTSIAQMFLPTQSESGEGLSKLLENFIGSSISDLIKTKKEIKKPMVVISPMMGEERESVVELQEAGVPVYSSFERALKAISNLIRYYEFLEGG
jgi:acyl-CoA synthetase (NDP forming)